MARRRLFWRELLRTWMQWLGVGIASIPAGLLLGAMLKEGFPLREARAVAVPVGFILALAIWGLLGRRLAAKVVPFAPAISQTVFQFEVSDGVIRTSPAFAVVVLCISVQIPSNGPSTHQVKTFTPVNIYALPQG
jgi:hypothetical protein